MKQDDEYDFNKVQLIVIETLYAIDLLLFILLGVAVIYNSYNFLYQARLGSPLVFIFYILAGLLSTTYIIYFTALLDQPR